MRALLVLNERSRFGLRDGDLVCRTLEELHVVCERDASAQNIEAIIAAGGDGTVIHAIPTAIARGLPLGVVPLGTFNDLARTLELPLNVREACEVIVAKRTRKIDVARVNGVYFVNEASVGVSTRIARRQTPEVKQRFGAVGVISTTIQSLRQTRPFTVELRYDGKREGFSTVQLTIANNARFGGIFHRSDASIADGWLDLYSIEIRTWVQALGAVRALLSGHPLDGKGLRTRRSTEFAVFTRHPHSIAADGEPAGTTPATFEILPRAIDVIIP